jgi:hypothetical protein
VLDNVLALLSSNAARARGVASNLGPGIDPSEGIEIVAQDRPENERAVSISSIYPNRSLALVAVDGWT